VEKKEVKMLLDESSTVASLGADTAHVHCAVAGCQGVRVSD